MGGCCERLAAWHRQSPVPIVTGVCPAAEATAGVLEECPICYTVARDVERLPHKEAAGDVSMHRACCRCREELVKRNASCPWCRTEMVWQTVFGFLDDLKKGARGYQEGQHNQLADLMGTWQEYEMSRTQSDIRLFAREMASDAAIAARINGALAGRSGWLRDSIGLWIRIFSMYADGEIELSHADGERLRRAVDEAIYVFEQDHGGHPHFLGAFYQQAAVAVLCAAISGLSTRTASELAKRVGAAVVRVYERHYRTRADGRQRVRERMTQEYVEAVT
eukprot:CAMPEP_0204521724 /NCGR_PEP_ID=MMETSP0661-20131031/5939_1 /ASSEMBLY_ACC=CAM_ASM_000606 /TAXON_ID=109239 /ORGANISM="Alexandrium margalefi, Strain AMGDE01CS-322" /LENGTH=277 /DNA_ID=CAMNT_0051527341 /DNA_START=17 /DNA_END=846 /DNA_ORIENTATION=-